MYVCLKLNEIKPQKQTNYIATLSPYCRKILDLCESPQSLRTGACLIHTGISLGKPSTYTMSSVFLVKAFLIRKCGLTQEMF